MTATRNRVWAAFLAIFLILPATHAQSAVMGFEGLASAGNFNNPPIPVASPYDEAGFRLTETPAGFGFSNYNTNSQFFPGSTSLQGATSGRTIVLTQIGRGPFSLNSISLSTVNILAPTPFALAFTGVLAGGGTVMTTFNLPGKLPLENYNFPLSFNNLTSVSWMQGGGGLGPGHQFDNVTLNQAIDVPVPATLPLLGIGLALTGFVGWRRKRAAAA